MRHNGALLGERMVSAHAPQVNLLGPNSGRIEVGTVVRWQASDADGDSLHYSVLA